MTIMIRRTHARRRSGAGCRRLPRHGSVHARSQPGATVPGTSVPATTTEKAPGTFDARVPGTPAPLWRSTRRRVLAMPSPHGAGARGSPYRSGGGDPSGFDWQRFRVVCSDSTAFRSALHRRRAVSPVPTSQRMRSSLAICCSSVRRRPAPRMSGWRSAAISSCTRRAHEGSCASSA